MNCPKCGAEAYLVEEEFVKVLENVDPPKVLAKAIYQCKSCGERFSRLIYEDLNTIKKEETQPSGSPPLGTKPSRESIEGLRFF